MYAQFSTSSALILTKIYSWFAHLWMLWPAGRAAFTMYLDNWISAERSTSRPCLTALCIAASSSHMCNWSQPMACSRQAWFLCNNVRSYSCTHVHVIKVVQRLMFDFSEAPSSSKILWKFVVQSVVIVSSTVLIQPHRALSKNNQCLHFRSLQIQSQTLILYQRSKKPNLRCWSIA